MRRLGDLRLKEPTNDIGHLREALWERMIVHEKITRDNKILEEFGSLNEEVAANFSPLELAILKSMLSSGEWQIAHLKEVL